MLRLFFTAVVTLCLTAACATPQAEPKQIDLAYVSREKVKLEANAPCVWINDARRHKAFYHVRVMREEALEWLGQGVHARLRARTRVTNDVPEKGLLITLQKAYINPIADKLGAVVVIKVTWGERETLYRGQKVQTNWWGAEREIGRTLSAALDDALLQINFPVTTSTCESSARLGDT